MNTRGEGEEGRASGQRGTAEEEGGGGGGPGEDRATGRHRGAPQIEPKKSRIHRKLSKGSGGEWK